jgi:glyoxylase-like metal-dependent hydrolase (beta-lactamase superfamily II)
VREGVTERLTEHVWAIPDGSGPGVPNVGIIAGSKGVLVVDTGMGPRNGATVLREVNRIAPGRQIYIVSTHFHPEHDLGAQAFPPEAKMIRSKAQAQDVIDAGMTLANTFASRSPLNAELLKDITVRPAAITFDSEYDLDLGGVKTRILAMGPNHTAGDTAVFVEKDAVLFSGDVAMRPLPVFGTPKATFANWFASFDKFDALKPAHVVPSHGLRGDAQIISGYRTYLTKVRDRAAVLKREGKTIDQAVETIGAELEGEFPQRARMASSIRAAWNEAR